jgi:hypothetical protein
MVLCSNGTLLSTSYYTERRGRSGYPFRFLTVKFTFPSGIDTITVGAGHTVVLTKDGKVRGGLALQVFILRQLRVGSGT